VTAPKVFLSYAHERADKLFVADLHKRLKRDGIECFFDEESIALGANFVLKISAAIDECNYLVMVMSPAYFSRRFTGAEWSPIFADDPQNERGRLMPLLFEECGIPRVLEPLRYIDVSSPEKFEKNYPNIRRHLGWLAPNDIEQRSREIDDLIHRREGDLAIMRILDFARDFSVGRTIVNRLAGITLELERIKDQIGPEASKARVEMLFDGLNLRDEIIDRLSLETSQ
jgi:hypothetical protein